MVFPALAALGGGFAVWSLARSVRRAARSYREGRRVRALPVVAGAIAVTILAILPSSRLVAMLGPARPGAPRILSGFADWLGAEGYPRINGRHSGVDVAGRPGAAVLAPADGRVVLAGDHRDSCGLIVVVEHEPEGYRSIHCHLSAVAVRRGEEVRRGDPVGAIGTSGMRAWPGYEHVHWELQNGRGGPREDPLARTVGCFDPARAYPRDRLALTYPVAC
jgi:murein DD-endopeptidase MepM/ murein hydrolase activator NlpD